MAPTTWDYQEKAGTTSPGGWVYDEVDMTYDQENDPQSGNKVYYDGVGLSSSWTYLSKTAIFITLLTNLI